MKLLANDMRAGDASPQTVHIDPAGYVRLGWGVVLLGVAGFLLWASLAPLDKGVPMSGSVARESNRKAVQHLSGGTIDDILVREGDTVKAGQVLVRMNSVQADAQADATRVQYYAARAAEARLIAERDGKDRVPVPPSMKDADHDPQARTALASQTQLFGARRAALHSELAALDESVAGLRSALAGTRAARVSKQAQLAILDEQITNLRALAAEGFVARSRLLDLERSHAQLAGALAEDAGAIGRGERQIAELGQKRSQRLQEFQRDVRAQLAEVQKEAGSLESRMTADAFVVSHVDLRAPVDGVVLGMNVFTKGGVVAPGFKLMDVVPTADALVVEGQLPVNLVDKVHPGLPVELIFSAFNSSSTPHIAGEITTVGADRLLDERTGAPYYKVSARVTPKGLAAMAAHKLDARPGMPVELFVKTGERTMMSYLLKPLFDRGRTALTEE
jgi:membrane fusion protein, protease secretion system